MRFTPNRGSEEHPFQHWGEVVGHADEAAFSRSMFGRTKRVRLQGHCVPRQSLFLGFQNGLRGALRGPRPTISVDLPLAAAII